MKKILTIGLIALAILGAGYAVKQRVVASPVELVETSASVLPNDGIVVTYFTTNVRCPSCRKIEELTRQTIQSRFAKQLETGELVFQVVNTDQPGNKHYIEEYQLVSKSVVASFRSDGKETHFENLQDVWLKLNDPADFENYVAATLNSDAKGGQ